MLTWGRTQSRPGGTLTAHVAGGVSSGCSAVALGSGNGIATLRLLPHRHKVCSGAEVAEQIGKGNRGACGWICLCRAGVVSGPLVTVGCVGEGGGRTARRRAPHSTASALRRSFNATALKLLLSLTRACLASCVVPADRMRNIEVRLGNTPVTGSDSYAPKKSGNNFCATFWGQTWAVGDRVRFSCAEGSTNGRWLSIQVRSNSIAESISLCEVRACTAWPQKWGGHHYAIGRRGAQPGFTVGQSNVCTAPCRQACLGKVSTC